MSQARDTLVLCFEILSARPELGPDVNLARFVWRVLELRSTCARLPHLPELIRGGDWYLIRPQLESVEQARFLASLMQAVSAPEIASAVERLQPETADTIKRQFLTEHAGAFLLASAALEAEPWEKKGPFSLYLTVLQCLGAPNAARTIVDPGLAAFAGLDAPPSPEDLAEQLAAWTPPLAAQETGDSWFSLAAPGGPLEAFPAIDAFLQPAGRGLLRNFLKRLGAFSDSTPKYTYANFLHCRGVVSLSAGRISVRYLTCPLRVVLRMAGFGSSPVALPWAGNKLLELDLD